MPFVQRCRRVVTSTKFQNLITVMILVAGAMVGIETNSALADRHRAALDVLDTFVLSIFGLEILLRMAAELPRPWRYFKDPWNVFDFLIVVGALMPFIASYALLLRLFRLLRVLRLVRTLPRLRRLVEALLVSLPSMFYVVVLLGMLFYIYGCAGVFFFGETSPENFGSLPVTMWSLFQLVTLENWPDLYASVEAAHGGLATAYFVTFILFGTMVMLNLVIGIIVQGMEEAKHPTTEELDPTAALKKELATLQAELGDLAFRTARIVQLLDSARPADVALPVPPRGEPGEERRLASGN
jgi:voltage-gated sodium channel